MKIIINLDRILSNATMYLSVMITMLIASCNGQQKDNDQVKNTVQIDTNTTVQEEISSSAINPMLQGFIADDLFYIEGQVCAWVRNIFEDKYGNLWFPTNHYGIMRYDGDRLVYFSEKDGVGNGRLTDIVEDQDGIIWIGTADGLTKYDGNSFVNLNFNKKGLNNEIWNLTIDNKQILWVGTTEGAFQFNGETFTPFSVPKAEVENPKTMYSFNRITDILEDKNGTLWFGTDGYGITKYDGTSFTFLTTEDGLPNNNISELMEDKNGDIWIATMFGGISRYNGKTFTNYTQEGIVEGIETGGFYEDHSGNIWFAAEHQGVYRYDGKTFTNFHKNEGLNTGGILSIFEDSQRRFWFGGWGGLFRLNGKSFVSVTKNGPWDK